MPKIRRQNLPPALLHHLLDRIRSREISADQLGLFAEWLDTEPEVPDEKWFKRFPAMTVCGQGGLVKTFLLPNSFQPEKKFSDLRSLSAAPPCHVVVSTKTESLAKAGLSWPRWQTPALSPADRHDGRAAGRLHCPRHKKGDVTPAGEKFCEILRQISSETD